MKNVFFMGFLCLVIVSFVSDTLFSQGTISPLKAKCGMDIFQGSGNVSSNGICYNTESSSSGLRVGKTSSQKERAVLQWEIPDNLIPDASTVTSVTLTIFYGKITNDAQPPLTLFNVGTDLENSPGLNDLWTKTDPAGATSIGTTDGFTNESGRIVGTFTSGSGFARAIEASLPSNKFTLGMAWMYELNQQNIYHEWLIWSHAYLTISYAPIMQPLTVDQILSGGTRYGNIELYKDGVFQTYPAPQTFSLPVNSTQYIRADTNKATVAGEKFNQWNYKSDDVINHKTLKIEEGIGNLTANFKEIGNATIKNSFEGLTSAGDTVRFQDPWLRDDNSDPKGLKNRGAGAIWHSYASPFVQNINSTRFKGVLLNQPRTSVNHYSVLAKPTIDLFLSQTGRTHRYYFYGWTSSNATTTYPMTAETPVVFTANNAEITANYKASQLSTSSGAFVNTSQRKFIRTLDGYYHLVYESMGKIWYEKSTNGGASWIIQNGGKPLNTDYVYNNQTGITTGSGNYTTAKHPAIDNYQNDIFIVWQEQSGTNYLIRLAFFRNGMPLRQANDIPFTCHGLYSEDVWPEIAVRDNLYGVIALKRNDAQFRGLEVHYVALLPDNATAIDEATGQIPGTDQNTGYFTLATDRSSTDKFHIAWEQGSQWTCSIKYARFNFTHESGGVYAPGNSSFNEAPASSEPGDPVTWQMNILKTVNVSNAASTIANFQPSMIAATDGTARVAFKGIEEYDPATGNGWYYTLLVNPDNTSWIPYLNRYSGRTFSPQISQGSETYFVGWTEPYGNSYRTICTDASTLRVMEAVQNSSGRDMQINNGGTRLQQFSMGFNSESTSLPYTFSRSDAIGTIVANKTLPISKGRGVYLTKDSHQLYFLIGNVNAGGTDINFPEMKDTVRLEDNIKKVNSFLLTEPFSLKDNSTVSFAIRYGSKDSASARNSMKEGQFASFKVNLIDDASGRVLGNYLDEKLDKDNIFRFKESVLKVSSNGIVNKLVRLRVSVDENMKSRYTISDLITGGGLPLSKSLKEVELNGSMEVKEYSLLQNYPNPFNPTTMISYTLPKASKVTLKVYDILGKEVATLVNGYEEMGKYSVEFNASSLPSGIYIYEIRANDFVKSGKMMLLK